MAGLEPASASHTRTKPGDAPSSARHTVYVYSITEAVLTVLPYGIRSSPALPHCFRPICCDVIATIQHFLTLSTHPLSLTLLPICFSVGCGFAATNRPTRELYRFGTYLAALVVLTDWIPSLSTPQLAGLFRCCLFAGFNLSMVCLLAGIARCTTLGVCGRCGIRTRDVLRSLSPFRGI